LKTYGKMIYTNMFSTKTDITVEIIILWTDGVGDISRWISFFK